MDDIVTINYSISKTVWDNFKKSKFASKYSNSREALQEALRSVSK